MTKPEPKPTDLAVPEPQQSMITSVSPDTAMTVEEVVEQVSHIQRIMKATMKDGEHFGTIPGCGPKPTLLQPGAQKLLLTFRMNPDYDVQVIDLPNQHREYRVKCNLTNTAGQFIGAGLGSCATMEGKYRYRTTAEVTDQPVPKDYWDLRKSNPKGAMDLIGGPGHGVKKTDSGSWVITKKGERVEHDNPADYYNTCLKMGKKRALVDAVLTRTAASDIFTQDIEEMAQNAAATGGRSQPESQPPTTPVSAGLDKLRTVLFPGLGNFPPKQHDKDGNATEYDIKLATPSDTNTKMDWAGKKLGSKKIKAIMTACSDRGFKTDDERHSLMNALYQAFEIDQRLQTVHTERMTDGHGGFLLSCLNHPNMMRKEPDEIAPWTRPKSEAGDVELDPDMDLEEDEDFFDDPETDGTFGSR